MGRNYSVRTTKFSLVVLFSIFINFQTLKILQHVEISIRTQENSDSTILKKVKSNDAYR